LSKLTARDVMTKGVIWCRDTDKAKNAARIMESKRVRRLPVIDANTRHRRKQEDGRHARSWRHLSRSVAEDGCQSGQGSFGSPPVRLGSAPNDARRDTQSEELPDAPRPS
jgi:CBS domain-containing protein